MKAFIDTSSMIKKYIEEPGSDRFDQLLEATSEIIVAPVYLLEVNAAIERRLKEKTIHLEEADWIRDAVNEDLVYYAKIVWSDNLEKKAIQLIRHHQIKTLDSIQLAAGILSAADIFVTSDKQLFQTTRAELTHVEFV